MTSPDTSPIVIVSGLPRSGTSMMMKALAAGGIAVLTDGLRTADEDNPGGYFELERVKKLADDTRWLSDAQGKAVKIIYRLLYKLPPSYRYQVIFMQRRLEEVIASQKLMLERQHREGSRLQDEQLLAAFRGEIMQIETWIREQPSIEVHYLDYNATLAEPQDCFEEIASFLGRRLDVAAMARVVDPSLYRNRSVAESVSGS